MPLHPDSRSDRKRENFELALLRETASRLSAAAPLQEMLDEVVKFVTTVAECDSCLVYVFEEGDLLLRASKHCYQESVDHLEAKMGQSVADWAAHLGAKTFVTSGYFARMPGGRALSHETIMKPIVLDELIAAVKRRIGHATD